jgi:MerR family transcriptional regulator, thiopeptide resistance regulator
MGRSIGEGSIVLSGYTVKQVAKLSGVSVRTLHHYDEVGLLKPACVGANGYRYYGRDELLRLQQILFHRELGFALEEIRQVLDAPDFDRITALTRHRAKLEAETKRYRRLVKTIDDTLAALQGATKMDEKAMYRGFDPQKQADHEAWLVDRYGRQMQARIDEAKQTMKGWSQADFDRLQAEAEAIEAGLAKALGDGLPADSTAVQALIRRQHAWVGASWNRPPTREAFIGLGGLYQENPDFRARYEGRSAGLTDYIVEAMRVFAEREL